MAVTGELEASCVKRDVQLPAVGEAENFLSGINNTLDQRDGLALLSVDLGDSLVDTRVGIAGPRAARELLE